MRLCVGTSGFSYAGWRGRFYPEDLPASGWLSYYAERLPAVEINHSFYRMPTPDLLAGWRERVPESFRFAVKAPRRITHLKRLADVAEETAFLRRTLESLGDRLGVVLFQLPPNLRVDLARLDTFLELWPGPRAVFEFRHASWDVEEVLERLHARGFSRALVDAEDAPEPELAAGAPFAYLRLRRPDYAAGDLARWARRVVASGVEEAFVFFKHEDEAVGPALARAFLEQAAA